MKWDVIRIVIFTLRMFKVNDAFMQIIHNHHCYNHLFDYKNIVVIVAVLK